MLKRVLRRVARDRRIDGAALNLMLVDDREITRLNDSFLGRRRPTDVIAFAGEDGLVGEIAVSIDTARRQARERSVPLYDELKLLVTHGLLHLLGYDDGSLAAWREMRQAEFESVVQVL